jgi:hypothetical protein
MFRYQKFWVCVRKQKSSYWKFPVQSFTAFESSHCSSLNYEIQGYAPGSSIQGSELLTLTRVDCLQLPCTRSSWNWIFVVHEHSPHKAKIKWKWNCCMKTWRFEKNSNFKVSNGTIKQHLLCFEKSPDGTHKNQMRSFVVTKLHYRQLVFANKLKDCFLASCRIIV